MNYPDDTIAAISTPPGEGGIGIVRISGKEAVTVADSIFSSPKNKRLKDAKSHTVIHGFIIDPATGGRVDEVLAVIMKAPSTYTREDVVEINCHGGMLPLRSTLGLLLRGGARLAEPGEFTRRAFLNGRIDLSQAEAVIDIIRAKTEAAERLALRQLEGKLSGRIALLKDRITGLCAHVEAFIDFPEEELDTAVTDELTGSMDVIAGELAALSKGFDEGRLFREGVATAIAGKPNVGKSSLLNALLERDRAIVTDMPGTTRDIVEDYFTINGLPLRIMDTAGIRDTHNRAEMEGVRRSMQAIEGADMVIAVLDASRPVDDADREVLDRVRNKKALVVINKTDVESPEFGSSAPEFGIPAIRISALRGEGLDLLKDEIYSLCVSPESHAEREDVLVTNVRHRQALDRAAQSLREAKESLITGKPLEVAALFLREALDHLGAIAGMVTTDDILNRIFSEFCIGK
jgi:tRNA modification GTPase